MTNSQNVLLVLVTSPSEEAALHIANEIVERKLAACANLLKGVSSVFRWQGSIERADEVLLLIKTTYERYRTLEETIVSLHPYDTPEILAVSVTQGLKAYCDWVCAESK